MALFIAFAPVGQPRYACAVLSSMARMRPSPGADGARYSAFRPEARSARQCPTAYPDQGGVAAWRKVGGRLMTLSPLCRRPAHAERRRQTVGSQLGPGAADHHYRLRRLRHALFGRRRHFSSLGGAADLRFVVGLVHSGGRGLDRYARLDEPGLSRLCRGAAAADRRGSRQAMWAWARSAGSRWDRSSCSPRS